jgi:poly(3-hydroxybutyrate) depolymerase
MPIVVLAFAPAGAFAVRSPTKPAMPLVRTFLYRAHNGVERPAVLLLPRGYHGQALPLVISPHGRGVGPAANARLWGNLPTHGGFAVVSPAGEGRRLGLYSWGDPGQIADLARMPALVRRHGVRIDRDRIYAVGGSMGGQETLLLVARYPRLLAGAAAFDPSTNMARRYWDFARLRDGRGLQALARLEIGGTPLTAPRAYAKRSPLTYVRRLAFSGVPIQLYWSTRDRVIADQRDESAVLIEDVFDSNPFARVISFHGEWRHSAEMRPFARLPRALARFGLLPWSVMRQRPGPSSLREETQARTPAGRLTSAVSKSARRSSAASIPTERRMRLRGAAKGALDVDA